MKRFSKVLSLVLVLAMVLSMFGFVVAEGEKVTCPYCGETESVTQGYEWQFSGVAAYLDELQCDITAHVHGDGTCDVASCTEGNAHTVHAAGNALCTTECLHDHGEWNNQKDCTWTQTCNGRHTGGGRHTESASCWSVNCSHTTCDGSDLITTCTGDHHTDDCCSIDEHTHDDTMSDANTCGIYVAAVCYGHTPEALPGTLTVTLPSSNTKTVTVSQNGVQVAQKETSGDSAVFTLPAGTYDVWASYSVTTNDGRNTTTTISYLSVSGVALPAGGKEEVNLTEGYQTAADHIDAKTDAAITIQEGQAVETWSNFKFSKVWYTSAKTGLWTSSTMSLDSSNSEYRAATDVYAALDTKVTFEFSVTVTKGSNVEEDVKKSITFDQSAVYPEKTYYKSTSTKAGNIRTYYGLTAKAVDGLNGEYYDITGKSIYEVANVVCNGTSVSLNNRSGGSWDFVLSPEAIKEVVEKGSLIVMKEISDYDSLSSNEKALVNAMEFEFKLTGVFDDPSNPGNTTVETRSAKATGHGGTASFPNLIVGNTYVLTETVDTENITAVSGPMTIKLTKDGEVAEETWKNALLDEELGNLVVTKTVRDLLAGDYDFYFKIKDESDEYITYDGAEVFKLSISVAGGTGTESYSFANLEPGAYTVEEVDNNGSNYKNYGAAAGYVFKTSSSVTVVNNVVVEAGNTAAATLSNVYGVPVVEPDPVTVTKKVWEAAYAAESFVAAEYPDPAEDSKWLDSASFTGLVHDTTSVTALFKVVITGPVGTSLENYVDVVTPEGSPAAVLLRPTAMPDAIPSSGSVTLYYKLDLTPTTAAVTYRNTAFVGEISDYAEVTVQKDAPPTDPVFGSFTLHKLGVWWENDDEVTWNMDNVTFTIYEDEVSTTGIEGVTKDGGLITFSNLKAGKSYILVETTPEGYWGEGPWTVTVAENGDITIKDNYGYTVSPNEAGIYEVENAVKSIGLVFFKTVSGSLSASQTAAMLNSITFSVSGTIIGSDKDFSQTLNLNWRTANEQFDEAYGDYVWGDVNVDEYEGEEYIYVSCVRVPMGAYTIAENDYGVLGYNVSSGWQIVRLYSMAPTALADLPSEENEYETDSGIGSYFEIKTTDENTYDAYGVIFSNNYTTSSIVTPPSSYSYTIVHEYYTEYANGRSFNGSNSSTVNFISSATVNTDEIARILQYGVNSDYTFESITPAGTITITSNGTTITLVYVRDMTEIEDTGTPLGELPGDSTDGSSGDLLSEIDEQGTPLSDAPATGDSNNIALLIVIMVLCALGIVLIIPKKRKQQ